MVRKITRMACDAFDNGYNMSLSNTNVSKGSLYLHGHEIARHNESGQTEINLCGWNTPTTRERLNGLSGVSVCQKDFTPYLNGKAIDSNSWYTV